MKFVLASILCYSSLYASCLYTPLELVKIQLREEIRCCSERMNDCEDENLMQNECYFILGQITGLNEAYHIIYEIETYHKLAL